MSPLFSLAADFIERMANPVYGIRVNEEYSMRLGELLANEEAVGLMRKEASNISDETTFSSAGWFWFLEWANVQSVKLEDSFLLRLAARWQNVPMLTLIIRNATRGQEIQSFDRYAAIDQLPKGFLRDLIRATTEVPDLPFEEGRRVDSRFAETVLMALIQADSALTTAAALAMIRYQWPGRAALERSFFAFVALLDADTAGMWQNRFQSY